MLRYSALAKAMLHDGEAIVPVVAAREIAKAQ
jgi:hypothetical protein